MADKGGGLLKAGLLAGGAYLLYEWLKPATAAAQSSATPGATPTAPSPAPAAPSVAYNSLDSIYQRLVQALQKNNVPQQQGQFVATPWGFDYFLNQVSGLSVGQLAGDMGAVFPGCGTGQACDTTAITLPQFWSAAAAVLNKTKGLTGLSGFIARGRRV